MDPELIKKIPDRNQGGMLKVGEKGDGNISDLIPLKGVGMIAVTRKTLYKILLADNIDPQRNNPNIPRHLQERIFDYGSDHPYIGRILLQAKELFLSGHLPDKIDKQKGVLIAMSFLKELLPMQEKIEKMKEEYSEIRNNFNGKLNENGSFMTPVFKNLERRTKEFIHNVDHMGRHILDLLNLFSIESTSKNPLQKLIELAKTKFGEKHEVVSFLLKVKEEMRWLRELRNDVEHPSESGMVTFENYKMIESGDIKPPQLNHTRDLSPFKCTDILLFAIKTNLSIVDLFEITMVLLCDLHAKDFAGDKVFVRNVNDSERTEVNPHMNYRYDINWTK